MEDIRFIDIHATKGGTRNESRRIKTRANDKK
jgi:hypothetical protein